MPGDGDSDSTGLSSRGDRSFPVSASEDCKKRHGEMETGLQLAKDISDTPKEFPDKPEKKRETYPPDSPRNGKRTRSRKDPLKKVRSERIPMIEVVQLYIPIMPLELYQFVLSPVRDAMTVDSISPRYVFDGDQLPAFRRSLRDILRFWQDCFLICASPSTTTLQETCLREKSDEHFSSRTYVESTVATGLNRFFTDILVTHKDTRGFRNFPSNRDVQHSRPVPPRTCHTFAFPINAHSIRTNVDVQQSKPPTNRGFLAVLGPGPFALFQPKTQSALRTIEWAEGDNLYTVRREDNFGEYLVKMEVYRWKEVSHLDSRDWWKHAVHRSQVLGNLNEDHIRMAQERAEQLKNLWVDVERGGHARFPTVTTRFDVPRHAQHHQQTPNRFTHPGCTIGSDF